MALIPVVGQRDVELEGAPDLVLVLRPVRDESGRYVDAEIEAANAAWRATFASADEDPTGLRLLEAFPAFAGRLEYIVRAIERGEAYLEVFAKPDDPTRRSIVHFVPLEGRVVAISHELTPEGALRAELRASEERFRAVFAEAPVGIALIDTATGRIQETNERFAEIAGRTREELRATGWMTITHPDDVQPQVDGIARIFAGQIPSFRMDKRYLRPDGSVVWISMTIAAVHAGAAASRQHVAIVEDITERRRAEEQSRAASKYARGLIEASLDPLVTISPVGTITDVNEATERVTGVARDLLIGTDFADYFTEPARARAGYETVLAQGFVRDYPLTIRDASGRTTDVLYNATVYHNEAGELQGVFAAARDITERKRAEEQVREQARLVDLAHDAVIVRDPDSRIVFWSAGAEETYGWTAEEAVGRVAHELLDTVFPIPREAIVTNLEATDEWRGELRHTARDGRRLVVESRWSLERDPAGKVLAILEVNRDVTELVRSTDALRAREAELADAQRLAHVGSWSWDPVTDAVEWSDELFRIFGLEIGDQASTFAEHQHMYTPEARAELQSAIARALETGQGYERHLDIIRPDGTIRHVVAAGEAVRDERGSIVGLRGALSDVTELREAQAQLDQAQRAEMVGRLAGGIAHDFNNLLAVISGYAEFLAASIPADDPRIGDVEAIREAAQRAATLTRQLLAFGRRQALRPTIVDVDTVVDGILPMLQSVVGGHVDLVVRRHGPVSRVRVDPTQLEQAIVNLVLNARDAMPRGGRVTIETADETVGADDPDLRAPALPGSYVRLTVTDTGVGIDAEALPHIFEPFFTTKELGHGAGLGLSSVEGAVAQSGGFVTVESEVGKGSSFSIHLPRAVGESATIPASTSRLTSVGGSETVLLVDDEPAVRGLAARTLRDLGYTVVEAGDPQSALAMANEPPTRVDILVTDIVMPGMDGRELAERLTSMYPGLPALFMSGYSPEHLIGDGLLERGAPLLTKPFAREDLAARVRALLDGRGTPAG